MGCSTQQQIKAEVFPLRGLPSQYRLPAPASIPHRHRQHTAASSHPYQKTMKDLSTPHRNVSFPALLPLAQLTFPSSVTTGLHTISPPWPEFIYPVQLEAPCSSHPPRLCYPNQQPPSSAPEMLTSHGYAGMYASMMQNPACRMTIYPTSKKQHVKTHVAMFISMLK